MVNAEHTVSLIEKCLALKEDRILRCGNNEPWGYSIMCAVFSLLEAHLGRQTSEAAKARSAERFINVHYKLLAGQDPPSSSRGQQSGKVPPPSEAPDRSKVGVERPLIPLFSRASVKLTVMAQSVTPFPSASQSSAQELGAVEAPPTPWWLAPVDPAVRLGPSGTPLGSVARH